MLFISSSYCTADSAIYAEYCTIRSAISIINIIKILINRTI